MNYNQSKLINLLFLVTLILGLETPLQAQTPKIDSINPKTGKVLLKREDWSNFRPVTEGISINEGDQIYPDKGIRVRIICPDFTSKPVTAGVPSGIKSICPTWEARINKAPPAAGVLGGIDASIPYLISPRHSLVLNNTPTFRWNAVADATEYTVELRSANGIIWKTQVKGTQIVYPGNPPLESGVSYSLNVEANTGKSSQQDGASNLAFIILRPAEAEIIQAEADKIKQKKLSPLVTGLLLGELYSNYVLPASSLSAYNLNSATSRSYNLTVEAIATLETLTKQEQNSPLVYRLRGELYWQSGLAEIAAGNYLKAIELAKSPEFLEEKTLAQFGLAEVYAATNNVKQAKFWYEEAKKGYIQLGDKGRVNFLNRRLEGLK